MSAAGLTIRPMTVGAEVVGLASGSEANPDTTRALYDAWLQHGFLLFRGVETVDRQIALSRCFGDLEIHPVPEVRHPENPYLIELGGPRRASAYVFNGTDLRVSRIAWHRDTAYTPDICKGAMLRMVEVPAHEGETMLADTAKAYDGLPEDVKRRLDGLEYKSTICTDHMSTIGRAGTFWQGVRVATELEDPGSAARRARTAGIDGRYPSVIHPAVLTHPESGRKCLFLSPTYVDQFLGLDPAESDALLWMLTNHMLQPRYVYKHSWHVNDAIIWDNRRCMHASPGNHPSEPRYGVRTTLAGPLRTGRYYDQDTKVPEIVLTD